MKTETSKGNFTEGKWRVVDCSVASKAIVNDYIDVAHVFCADKAPLISAAPEMFEALQNVDSMQSIINKPNPSNLEYEEIRAMFVQVREAIKKATTKY